MNGFVKYVIENGGDEYDLFYSPRILEGKYCSCNTSCVWFNDELIINSRLVNYRKLFQSNELKFIPENHAQTYYYLKNGFDTRNVISRYTNGKLNNVIECKYPGENFWDVYYRGLEDCRLVNWNHRLYAYGTRWDRVKDKGCICIYELDDNFQPHNEIVIQPQGCGNCEKNWGAVSDKPFTFVYLNNPVQVVEVNKFGDCWLVNEHPKNENIKYQIKGSTQVVRYDENTYISLVHTNNWFKDGIIDRSDYLTAFAFYDNDFNLIKLSDWFVFRSPMCEFSCGLAVKDDDVYITYSQLDCTSHLLITNKQTVEKFINLENDLNNTDTFIDVYSRAKEFEKNGQIISSYILYNYASLLYNNEPYFINFEVECLIKTYFNVIEQQPHCRVSYFDDAAESLKKTIKKYQDCCEFYYLLSYLYKLSGNADEYSRYKQLGDERKLNIHNYFFNYLNPNYL